jgi:hypothetical protein
LENVGINGKFNVKIDGKNMVGKFLKCCTSYQEVPWSDSSGDETMVTLN